VGRDAERLEASLDGAGPASARLKLLGHELRRRLKHAEHPDQLVAAAVARLRNTQPRSVSAIAEEVGISERQLRRRFQATVGYGPKTLARVLRFQRMLAIARERSSRDLGQLAVDAGYADQAHMTAECTRLAGLPPGRLIAERYLL
jgi:methylphosphotriester-DNA--protein-cysteine methyltransferase